MKKLSTHLVLATVLACGVMPAMAHALGAQSDPSAGTLNGPAAAGEPAKTARIAATAEKEGMVLIGDMDRKATGHRDGRFGRRRPARSAEPVAWRRETTAGESIAGVPVLEESVIDNQDGAWDRGDWSSDDGDGATCHAAAGDGCHRWAHTTGGFGEYLYLRARDAEVTYASPVDGATVPIPGPGNQVGPVGIVDPDFASGVRVGFNWAWDDRTSLRGTYTHFESDTTNAITAEPGNFILAAVTHPGVNNAGNNWLDATASLDVDFQLADVEYRWLFSHSDRQAVNLFAGARYGELLQDFRGVFSPNGTRTVDTRIRFEGGGLRVGVDAERYAACTGWMVYGRGAASFVAGEFRGSYSQRSSFADPEINTAWKAGRVVTMLDLELGVGWKSHSGRLQLSAGYLVSAWLNTVQTDTLIGAVQANRFADLGGETTTFDGFTGRVEYHF